MLSQDCLSELRTSWMPNLTDSALDRLIDLLERESPFLVHGCFTKAMPMGCLATHAAWHHPDTCHLNAEAGINWLHTVACLNPATSLVIREWDAHGPRDWQFRQELLNLFQDERKNRNGEGCPVNRLAELAVL